jgi:hypothetical protein
LRRPWLTVGDVDNQSDDAYGDQGPSIPVHDTPQFTAEGSALAMDGHLGT